MSLYKEKFVMFVDILGWGELVYNSETDETILRQLHAVNKLLLEINSFTPEATDEINNVLVELVKKSIDIEPASVKALQFSDSLVFTFDGTAMSFTYAYAVISAISSILANIGYFFRGGIDYGNVHHEDGGIFGPAMNNAYYLESKEANYPRILLSERAQEVVSKLHIPSNFTFIDNDMLCLNNFNNLSNIEDIKNIVNDKINLYEKDDKLKRKYQWVKERLDKL